MRRERPAARPRPRARAAALRALIALIALGARAAADRDDTSAPEADGGGLAAPEADGAELAAPSRGMHPPAADVDGEDPMRQHSYLDVVYYDGSLGGAWDASIVISEEENRMLVFVSPYDPDCLEEWFYTEEDFEGFCDDASGKTKMSLRWAL